MGPIPQDLQYHDFADKRKIAGIPNFWDVASNLPMFFIGLFGLAYSLRTYNDRDGLVAKSIPILLSIGIFTACFGSAYYHLAPDNQTLVWDRLPMTFMFMPLFALLVYDFVGRKAGEWIFYIFIPFGVFSVFYWQYSESIGHGDLRPYAFVQFFPMLILPFIIWLFPKKVSYLSYIFHILGWYILAKIAEHFDHFLYNFTGFWSGHTIKHLLACVSLYYIIKLLMEWKRPQTSIIK
jgi:hypothetical protein